MSPAEIEHALDQMEYDNDNRRAPDERRRARFQVGWKDATQRSEIYSASTLSRLTWMNLGYRLGQRFGDAAPDTIDVVYVHLASLWLELKTAVPSVEQYVAAFRKLGAIADSQVQMLRLHYHAPGRTVTATHLAHATGYRHYSIANLQYGRLGRLVGEQLEYNPTKVRVGTLVLFEKRQGEWHWIMRPEVAKALEFLGWLDGTAMLLPEEIEAATSPLMEGAVCRVMVNAYERNPEARRRCIEAYGTNCHVCTFSFGAAYGVVAEGYIHVHHLHPLSNICGEHDIDPVKDLRPVCPNCHAVLHRRIPAFSIDEVREFLCGRVLMAIPHGKLVPRVRSMGTR